MDALLPASLQPTFPYLGIVRELQAVAYHGAGGLSYSGLKLFAKSPAHFFAWKRDARRPPDPERGGQLEGELAHCGTLEPGEYGFRYAIGPEVSRATTAWKSFVAGNPGRTCIKPSQHAAAMAQAASVRQHADVGKLLAAGHPEVSAFWRDPLTGIMCQCRPDWVHPVGSETVPGVILLDVKTYSDASPEEFERQVARKRYHWQAAHYSDGYSIAAGVPVVGFVFVAVETEWPYACCAHMLDEESLAIARAELRPLIDRYAECNASGVWPSYPGSIQQISLPRWYAGRAAE